METVTLGDAEAKHRKCAKSILERRALPTFDFVVEMRERNYWVTHQVCQSNSYLIYRYEQILLGSAGLQKITVSLHDSLTAGAWRNMSLIMEERLPWIKIVVILTCSFFIVSLFMK